MSDINRLLDNGVTVVLFRNGLGSYTAFAVENEHEEIDLAKEDADEEDRLTDDFTPERAIARLADKLMGVGDYNDSSS